MAGSELDEVSQAHIEALLEYWFEYLPAEPSSLKALMKKWFLSSDQQDRELCARFGPLAEKAAGGELDAWAETPRGRLALIILLDQLSRNLHRGRPGAFAQDPRALELCIGGMAENLDSALDPLERIFFYMPLQHSESKEMQALSAAIFGRLANEDHGKALAPLLRNTAHYADEHKDIVDRFGRFPHRNTVLERESTEAELEFLASGGSSFGQ